MDASWINLIPQKLRPLGASKRDTDADVQHINAERAICTKAHLCSDQLDSTLRTQINNILQN